MTKKYSNQLPVIRDYNFMGTSELISAIGRNVDPATSRGDLIRMALEADKTRSK